MATIVSAQTGNWADTSTWVGGVVPGSGDDVDCTNSFDIVTLSGDGPFVCNTLIGTDALRLNGNTLTATNGITTSGSSSYGWQVDGNVVGNINGDVTNITDTTWTINGNVSGNVRFNSGASTLLLHILGHVLGEIFSEDNTGQFWGVTVGGMVGGISVVQASGDSPFITVGGASGGVTASANGLIITVNGDVGGQLVQHYNGGSSTVTVHGSVLSDIQRIVDQNPNGQSANLTIDGDILGSYSEQPGFYGDVNVAGRVHGSSSNYVAVTGQVRSFGLLGPTTILFNDGNGTQQMAVGSFTAVPYPTAAQVLSGVPTGKYDGTVGTLRTRRKFLAADLAADARF